MISCSDDQDEVGDRHRGEEPERRAPRRASARRSRTRWAAARPGRYHGCRRPARSATYARQERQPQVAARQVGAAVERDVVGQVGDGQRRSRRVRLRPRPGRPAAARAGTGASGPRPSRGRRTSHGTRHGSADRGRSSLPRIVSVRRGGSVSGVWPASSSTPSANRSSSSSVLKKPTQIRSASRRRDRPGDREDRAPSSSSGGLPPSSRAMRNVTSVAMRCARRHERRRPGIAARRSAAARRGQRRPARGPTASPTNIDSQPSERAIPTIDGRWKLRRLEPARAGQQRRRPEVERLEREERRVRRARGCPRSPADRQRAHALGAEQPLLGGQRVQRRRRAPRHGPGSRRRPARRR